MSTTHDSLFIALSHRMATQFGAQIRELAPSSVLLPLARGEAVPEELDRAAISWFSEDLWTDGAVPELFPRLVGPAGLRWFHTFSAGTDHPAFAALAARGVRITSCPGLTSGPIAEHVLGMMLRIARGFDEAARAQAARTWRQRVGRELAGATVGIVGLGNVGERVARLSKALEMRVLAVRRSPAPSACADEVFGTERLTEVLARADYVVLALPLRAETTTLIDAAALRAMRPGAWLINVSRGAIIDEAALLNSLQSGLIAGAALDVFVEEPLPPAHPLWTAPNVIVTAHTAGLSDRNLERGGARFLENLERFTSGEALLAERDAKEAR